LILECLRLALLTTPWLCRSIAVWNVLVVSWLVVRPKMISTWSRAAEVEVAAMPERCCWLARTRRLRPRVGHQGRGTRPDGWSTMPEPSRIAEAMDYLNSALRLSQRSDSKRLESIARQHLSRIHTRLGDYQLALTHAELGLVLHQQTNDREGDAYALHRLALVWQGIGDHQKVIELCTQAIDVARTYTVFPPQTAATLDALATALHHNGDHPQAIACLHEALKIYEQFDDGRTTATRHRLQALQASNQNQDNRADPAGLIVSPKLG
jgi:Tetratricopeptide repeat